MSLLYPPQIAATRSLASYLRGVMPDVSIEEIWPDPDKSLPNLAVTIIPAGPRNLLYMDGPQLITSTPINSTTANYQWRIAECEQPLQMDVWAHFAGDRDDLVARLDRYINVGYTQLSGIRPLLQMPVERYIALNMADGWEGSNAVFYFDSCSYDDSAVQTMRVEYRATYRGMGFFNLSQWATSPTLAQVNFQTKLYDSDQNVHSSQYMVTDSTETFTEDIGS